MLEQTTSRLEPLPIRRLLSMILQGQIRIPMFQRGFVWEPDMVARFMDSIYKQFPFGSLLLWRTREPLKSERNLGPFELPKVDPAYPIDYVLDGQQRITSIFGVFQTTLLPKLKEPWMDVYFDFSAATDIQESQFVALDLSAFDPSKHFPLRAILDPVRYREAAKYLNDDIIVRIDGLQRIFQESQVPVQYIETEDKTAVAIIFERINRGGVPLDTLQLLSAWTWSDEFALQDRFSELTAELTPFGFKEIGEDANLLLRCCAACLAGDASPSTLVSLNGSMVRERFQEVVNGINGAIDFLRSNLMVASIDNLPYTTLLVPLSVFFSIRGTEQLRTTDAQRKSLVTWFWRCCFSKRYSSGVLRNLKTDIDGMNALKSGKSTDIVNIPCSIDVDFFGRNTFRVSNVNTKTFVLFLAQQRPLSFISGNPVNLGEVLKDYNRNEFHHLFPRAFLQRQNYSDEDINQLTNFCFMSRSDNNQLGGVSPRDYRNKMPAVTDEILSRSLCPSSLLSADYKQFLDERSRLLTEAAQKFISP